MFSSRPQRLENGSLIHETRSLQRKNSRKIKKSMQQITRIGCSNPLNRKKRVHSIDLLMQRSGVRSIAYWHDLEECRTFLDCKKMPEKLAAQKSR
jgi:SET domain-containing protein